jgi:hypothetical protein
MDGPFCRRGVVTVIGLATAVCLTSSSVTYGQTLAPAQAIGLLDAVQAAKPPAIDGTVGENEWQDAALASNFIQFEPQRGDPSAIRTESLVLYDAGHLYVAFRAWDPEGVTAQLTQRDAELLRDDAVVVVLDTTKDLHEPRAIDAGSKTTDTPEHERIKDEHVEAGKQEEEHLDVKGRVIQVLVRLRHQEHRSAHRVDGESNHREWHETMERGNRDALPHSEQAEVPHRDRPEQ